MEYRQTIGSAELSGVLNLPPMLRNRQVDITVVPAASKAVNEEPKPKRQLNLDFLAGKVSKLPDSFFDPLPEEELQAWEL